MTAPYGTEFEFRGAETPKAGESITLDQKPSEVKAGDPGKTAQRKELPPPILDITDEAKTAFRIWLDQWIDDLESAQAPKQKQWGEWEEAYRGTSPQALAFEPFKGSSKEVIPLAAMAVDPIHARLDTGIFKQDPVFTFKALRHDLGDVVGGVSKFVEFYQHSMLKLRQIASPRLLEMTKLGTAVFKVTFDRDEYETLGYDDNYEVIKTKQTRFVGPRISGVGLGDILFPSHYQHAQDCPIILERVRTTYEKIKVLEATGKLTNCDKIKGQETTERTTLEQAREKATNHGPGIIQFQNELRLFEGYCDYDINGDGLPERLIVTYHKDTGTFLQLRLNWYFHQKKPYVFIPYSVVNDSLYGLGVVEMAMPFQKALTDWQRHASNNAYIANIRMFIAKTGSKIEEVPRLYAGRTFFVDDPAKDFIPFAMGDVYPSTLAERQNLFGMAEKRIGVSDYMQGRESPIVGTRATATGTLAIIQEGARRVEEVLENVRVGFSEIMELCISIWIQYGTNDLEKMVFQGDETAKQVEVFFKSVNQANVNGLIAIELTVTDASTSKQSQQQMQLALIQVMMQYLEKLLTAGQGALQAIQAGVPQYAEMVAAVMDAARKMFTDLLKTYDTIRNAEDYLPDLRRYLNGQQMAPAGPGVGAGAEGQPGGPGVNPSLPVSNGPARTPVVPRPAAPGSGGQSPAAAAVARAAGS